MGKSVYSLVLSDEVVEAVDQMAYSLNTSRSNLINQILAEKVSLLTPEMRMRDIFSQIEKLMDSRFQILDQPSDAMLSMKSPLKYKYKPTIKYSLELSRDFQGKVGKLKVMLRTQSAGLISMADGFFELWTRLENQFLRNAFPNGVPCEYGGGRYARELYQTSQISMTDEDIANAVGQYIGVFDKCIQAYFENENSLEEAEKISTQLYGGYLKKDVAVI